ncbi:transposase of ISEc13 [Escherichia coli DEC6E]|nr:transposase of ISEc13 [Escherichia coli DEC6E]EHV80133.1 transposase of ISEc13 [Escherichia coli DEC6D]
MLISYSEVSIKNPDNSGQALPFTYVCCREQALLASADVRKSGECR